MELILREYQKTDSQAIEDVYKDAMDSLRISRGGLHSDISVDDMTGRPDGEILNELTYGGTLLIAQDKDSGEICGIGGIGHRWIHRLIGSAYSRSHYVRQSFQRGRKGLNVGTMIRAAILERARSMGFRKLYGFSTPEAINFHTKFYARFLPFFNRTFNGGKTVLHYYEIDLEPNLFNRIPMEPFILSMTDAYVRFRSYLKSS